jgi:hypothetical protein
MDTRLSSFPCRAVLAFAVLAALPCAAQAQAVIEWSRAASETPLGALPQRPRIEAMASLAVHDALNAIEPRYESYGVIPAAANGASPAAAIATAAHHVLVAQAPASAAALDTRYANFLAALPPCAAAHPDCIATGVQAGANAAASILAMRANDGSATPDLPYAAPLVAGVYQQTVGSPPPRFEGWQYVVPFGVRSASQFRADDNEVMHLTSSTYARDYNEVKQKGSALVRGAAPDSAESDIARFWPGGGADWPTVTRTLAQVLALDEWQRARVFALLEMAQADSAITVFETKYHYRFWRPSTAIRWLGGDGNAATTPDADWLPFLATPPYPDYVCGLTIVAGAGTEVLRRYFRTDAIAYTFTAHAPAQPLPAPMAALPAKDITRSYASLSQASAESASARVYGGMHFRSGCVAGVRQGEKIGRFVFLHWLRPLR